MSIPSSSSTLSLLHLPNEDKENLWDSTLIDEREEILLCSHAIARGKTVYGTQCSSEAEDWISWRTTLDHNVGQICSNDNGSIVVASTVAGSVSLLAGNDGSLLATRMVSSTQGLANVGFACSSGTDTLLIVVPDNSKSSAQVVLVSNIDGPALNHEQSVTEATKNMTIEAVSFPLRNVMHVKAVHDGERFRFALVTTEGKLVFYDYVNKQSTLVGESNLVVQVTAGLKVQHHEAAQRTYFVFSTMGKQSASSLVWFETSQLTSVCEIALKNKVVTFEPLLSSLDASALVLAVATKDVIQVVQACIEETMGLILLERVHVVYQIPIKGKTLSSITIPYSFRFIGQEDLIQQFKPSPFAARVRLLLQRDRFDEAEAIVSEGNPSDEDYSDFHASELYLRRLQHTLRNQVSTKAMAVAQSCLHQLTHLDGSNMAVDNLMTASEEILHWRAPSIASYKLALSTLSHLLRSIDAPPTAIDRIRKMQQQLENTDEALQALLCLLDNEDVPMEGAFVEVRNMSDLLKALLLEGLVGAAYALHRSNKNLFPEDIASAIIALPPVISIDPRHYVPLLESAILGLTVKHSLLPAISAWACRTANALAPDIKSAIFLLEKIHNAMNQLHARIFSSFASFNPFVETSSRISSPRNTDTSASFQSFDGLTLQTNKQKGSYDQSVPTILELGKLKGGAVKSHQLSLHSDDDECDDVEVKLRHAQLVYKAGELGLDGGELRHFVRKGGASYLARQLVQQFSQGTTCHAIRIELLHSKVKPFCDESEVCFDEVLVSYAEKVSESKQMSLAMIAETSSLARCCVSDNSKCKITLALLRAALLHGASTPCLTTLSHDAILWAGGDLAMRSELTEASRLLVISRIVVTYCGRAAALELFRVDNPTHAIKLLVHVCRHITYPEALSDAFKLCDAFAHATKEYACIQMLENAILSGPVDICSKMMKNIISKETNVAKSIWKRSIEFCSITLLDECGKLRSSKFLKTDCNIAIRLCSKALAVLDVVRQGLPAKLLDSTEVERLLDSYQRVQRLQRHHNIFVSPLEMDCPVIQSKIVGSLVSSIREYFGHAGNDSLSCFEKAQRAAKLLVGPIMMPSVWFVAVEREACQLVWSMDDGKSVQFLVESGTLDNLSNAEAAHAVLSVVLNYCKRASHRGHESNQNNVVSQMKFMLRASQLLHDYVLVGCPSQLIDAVSSLSSLTEAIGRVLLMADNGVGDELQNHRRQLKLWRRSVSSMEGKASSVVLGRNKRPILHGDWYVGDGLLLPLDETQEGCLEFCMDLAGLVLCNHAPSLRGSDQLHSLLDDRGAHAAALRVGCLTMANVLSFSVFNPKENFHNLIAFSGSYQSTLKSLAERSLGGSGNGITNPKVDCGLALSYIHLLTTKIAFQVYRASLPSAVSKRDFKRVRTLSSIGVLAGKGFPGYSEIVPASWKKQGKFVEQCERLSLRARWWVALQLLQVDFEPRRFDESSPSDSALIDPASGIRNETHYAASLLMPLITKCCSELKDANAARNVALSFALSFGIEKQLAALTHVEFLLSCQSIESESLNDVRIDLSACEKAVRVSLKHVSSPLKKAAVLRKALVGLEATIQFDTDYERHGLLLSMYYDDLANVVGCDTTKKKIDIAPFVAELEAIARRRDALSVLMSFFEGDFRKHRPAFPKFFKPLPIVFGIDPAEKELSRFSVLGPIGLTPSGLFDPLAPLQEFLSEHADASTATALAPLCIPLDLPSGYVHARGLVTRFKASAASQSPPPSLEIEVLPVLNRLKSSMSQATLAEWCASMYLEIDSQKAKCLDIALEHAMKASSDIELRVGRDKSCDLAIEEKEALERVRRISSDKSMLLDKNHVKKILVKSKFGDSDQFRAAKRMIDDLTARLNESLWNQADAAPDKFVELFLIEASTVASEACVSMANSFALDHLRYTATVVHKACKDISDQYSHVHVSALCRKLARRWLVHGDSGSSPNHEESQKSNPRILSTPRCDHDENETVTFVMDLSAFANGDRLWLDDIGSTRHSQKEEGLVTREEEPYVLDELGSVREVSELKCAKIALRIAFVMSFAEGYHPVDPKSPSQGIENAGDTNNKQAFRRGRHAKPRKGLLSRILVGESIHDTVVMNHGKELLRVVFAKMGGHREGVNELSNSFNSTAASELEVKATTFAMRYRALRTAAILCPQEALERIIKDEGFLQSSTGDPSGTLRQCAFGAFVAKEIEEMGLALPHSDLAQLSTMQFSSYARALRRNHDTNSLEAKGRLLLLLIEMSTVPGQTLDVHFVRTILLEMRSLNLPRSLLHACERYLDFVDSRTSDENPASLVEIVDITLFLVDSSLKEARASLLSKGIPTLLRVAALAQRLNGIKSEVSVIFAEGLASIMSSTEGGILKTELSELMTKLRFPTNADTEESALIGGSTTMRARLALLHG